MPVSNLFASCPEFSTDAPVAATPILVLDQLEQTDGFKLGPLFRACRDYGYFSLDLRGSVKGEHLLEAAERMFDVATQTFDLGQEVLSKFAADFPKDHRGYKRAGQFKTENGNPDVVEVYTVGQDDVTGVGSPKEKRGALTDRHADCEDFVRSAYEVILTLFGALDRVLRLPSGTLASLSPIEKASPTSFRLVRSHPQAASAEDKEPDRIAMSGHTDIGTITLVFNVVGGLQVLPAGCSKANENWRYVKPKVGCVLVQIADTLVEWTGGLLRSNLHRVVDPPGKQAETVRQSLVYLSRPAYGGSMQRLKGGTVIPPLAENERDETRSPEEWAAWRTKQIMMGELKPESHGGLVAA